MTTNTAFGPQGNNAVTMLPAGTSTNRYGVGVDTWVKDCVPGGASGTVLDAAFFNMLIGNLRGAINGAIADGANFSANDGDMTLLWKAIKSQQSISVGPGLSLVGGVINIDVPALKVMLA